MRKELQLLGNNRDEATTTFKKLASSNVTNEQAPPSLIGLKCIESAIQVSTFVKSFNAYNGPVPVPSFDAFVHVHKLLQRSLSKHLSHLSLLILGFHAKTSPRLESWHLLWYAQSLVMGSSMKMRCVLNVCSATWWATYLSLLFPELFENWIETLLRKGVIVCSCSSAICCNSGASLSHPTHRRSQLLWII